MQYDYCIIFVVDVLHKITL